MYVCSGKLLGWVNAWVNAWVTEEFGQKLGAITACFVNCFEYSRIPLTNNYNCNVAVTTCTLTVLICSAEFKKSYPSLALAAS